MAAAPPQQGAAVRAQSTAYDMAAAPPKQGAAVRAQSTA